MRTKILLTLTCLFWQALVWGQKQTLVKKGFKSLSVEGIIAIGNKVIFSADDGVNGEELWVSDGSETGTYMLKDINVGAQSGSPKFFRKYGNVIVFEGLVRFNRPQLFRTDGTETGTFQIWDKGYSPKPVEIIVDSTIYLVTNNSLLIKDFNNFSSKTILDRTISPEIHLFGSEKSFESIYNGPRSEVFIRQYIIRFRDKWLFNGYNSTYDEYGIYISDGTVVGTNKIFTSKSAISFVKSETPSGQLAFFSAYNEKTGTELWSTDGTINGTKMVKDISPGEKSSFIFELEGNSVNNGIVFKADDGINGTELWFSDGSEIGTKMIKEFIPGYDSGAYGCFFLDPLDKTASFFFNQSKNPGLSQLWRTDGSTNGTKPVADAYYSPFGSTNFVKEGNYLYYTNLEKDVYIAIYRIDIKTNVVTKIFNSGALIGTYFTIAGNYLYYFYGNELWKVPLPSACSHTAKINTPNGTSFCPGSSVSITGEGSGTTSPFTYKWKQGTTDAGTAATLAVTKAGTYTVEVTDKEGCTVSASIDITQTTNLPINITGANSFCAGQTTTLTANATGGVSPYTYQWKQNSVNVGTNATTYAASAAGSYSVAVTDSKGCTGTSAAYSVTQKPSPNVTVSSSRTPTLLTGESVVLSVPTAAGQTYQWAKDGVAISGATNNSYTVSGAGSYTVTVTGSGCTATSSAVMVSIILANEPLAEEVGLRVSPNPAINQAKIVLQLAQSASANVYVLDASGKRVRTWESGAKATRHEVMLDMRSVAAGNYVVQAEAEGQVFTEKLVKQ